MEAPPAPWFMLVGGINGAGKSTFSQSPETLRKLVELSPAEAVEIINPDTVTRAILAENPKLTQSEANLRAAEECEHRVKTYIKERRAHFVIETVLASDKYRPIVNRARKLGWNVLFVYVALPTIETAIERVRIRVANGGHDVPEDKIRKRWPISLNNLEWFWRTATTCTLVLNADDEQRNLASKQREVTTIHHVPACAHALRPVLRATADVCGMGSD